MDRTEGPDRERCATCGVVVTGPFCASCGEKVVDEEALTLRGFAAGAFTSLTDLERGLWPTVKLLLTRPGFLTVEYLAGRRLRYLRPFRLFLLVNVLYFLVQPYSGSNTYNTTLRSHLERQFYSEQVAAIVTPELAERGIDRTDFEPGFNRLSSGFARSLIIVLVPCLAAVVALRYRRRGVPAVGHLVFALHYLAYFLLAGSIGLGFLTVGLVEALRAADRPLPSWFNELTGTLALMAVGMLYLVPAVRRVYGAGWLDAALFSLGLSFLFFPVVILYRYLLFWVTWLVI